MVYGICNQTLIQVRLEPSEKSEMVSQILFGETYLILEKFQKWYRVQNMYDSYQGWINSSLHIPLSELSYNKLIKEIPVILDKPISYARQLSKDGVYWLLAGSAVYGLKGKTFSIEKEIFTLDAVPEDNSNKPVREFMAQLAISMLNIPYLWGGRSTFGIDCSGLSQLIYKIAGLSLRRDAKDQFKQGLEISLENTKPCDLAFFGNDDSSITHVGIVLSDSRIVHASGKVRIDNLDCQGIFNNIQKEYSHKLIGIRSYLV